MAFLALLTMELVLVLRAQPAEIKVKNKTTSKRIKISLPMKKVKIVRIVR